MKFACPHCGQHIDADDTWIGKEATCPSCAAAFVVPAQSNPEVPGPSTQPPTDNKLPFIARKHPPAATHLKTPFVVVLIVLTLLGGTVLLLPFVIHFVQLQMDFNRVHTKGSADRRSEQSLPQNVVIDAKGEKRPAPGYEWLTDKEGDYRVVPVKPYINESYYDLRDEEKASASRAGLSADDTQAKWHAVLDNVRRAFERKYIGKYVKWRGGQIADIKEEHGQFICHIEMDPKEFFSTADIHFPVSRQRAMELKKGREVWVDGRITGLSGSLKVDMDDVNVSYVDDLYNQFP